MRSLQRRDAAVGERERARVGRKGLIELPLRQIEAGREPEAPPEPERRVTAEAHAAFPPGARDDEGLDEVALDAVVTRRLVKIGRASCRERVGMWGREEVV